MNLITLFSEKARHKRSHVVGFCFCEMSGIGKSKQTVTRLVDPGGGGCGVGIWEQLFNGDGVSFRADEKVLELDSGNGCTVW